MIVKTATGRSRETKELAVLSLVDHICQPTLYVAVLPPRSCLRSQSWAYFVPHCTSHDTISEIYPDLSIYLSIAWFRYTIPRCCYIVSLFS